jgi:hypothetical protein
VSAKKKEFIVLAVGDRESCGYDEHTFPLLVQLVDSSAPDLRQISHPDLIAYYVRSSRTIAAVEDVLSRAERLRDTDVRFATLGIGLAHGLMVADFDWLGRLNQKFPPLGIAVIHASAGVRRAQTYREIFAQLHEQNAA